ncbi:MAG TPA: hypothetical protein VNZ44_19335 [Pyrinomonadaceae bacterium]|nr:hypothetical protein [Pyrinomonadaceae bacterium]
MRKSSVVLAVIAAVLVSGGTARGQSPQTPAGPARPASDRVLGEVTAIDAAGKKISVKAEAGQAVTVGVDDKTLYRRIPPGETNIEKAVVIGFADIAVGDRVLARGKLDADTIQARVLLVMSRAELARSEEQSKAEWERRGISGTIVGLNPATKEITVKARTAMGAATIRVNASGDGVRLKRYAPNSTRYRDAAPGTFEQLKVGDQIRALGDRSEDGASFKPEEIVSGSFRLAGGIITAVNSSTGEITLRDIKTQQPLTVTLSKESVLRRLPGELLVRMEESMQSSETPQTTQVAGGGTIQEIRVMTPNGPGIRRIYIPPAGQQGAPPPPPPGNVPRGADIRVVTSASSPNQGAATAVSAGVDYQEAIEKLPPITIADLKPGDGIIVSSAGGSDPSRVTAITLAAGVEEFLKRQEEARKSRPGYELDLGLPGIGAQ